MDIDAYLFFRHLFYAKIIPSIIYQGLYLYFQNLPIIIILIIVIKMHADCAQIMPA